MDLELNSSLKEHTSISIDNLTEILCTYILPVRIWHIPTRRWLGYRFTITISNGKVIHGILQTNGFRNGTTIRFKAPNSSLKIKVLVSEFDGKVTVSSIL